MSNSTTTTPRIKLTQTAFTNIAQAVGRLEDIKELSPLATTREVEAEALGLVEFLSKELIDHAPELLGAWFVLKNEYEPLCNVFLPVVNRANSIIGQRVAAQQAKIEAVKAGIASEADNVIKLR